MHPGNAAEQLRNALNRAGHSCGRGLGRQAGRRWLQAGPRSASLQLAGYGPDHPAWDGPRDGAGRGLPGCPS